MRVSTLSIFMQGITAIQNQQSKLQATELQLTTGKRINKPSDDPAGAVKILDLQASMARIDQFSRNAALAEASLGFEENTIDSVQTNLQRIRELVIQGNNATNSDTSKQSIAAELYQRLDELVALANSRDAQGEYIFAGNKIDSPPFVNSAGTVTYVGDQGQRLIQVADGSQLAIRDSGDSVFQRIPSGDGRIQVIANSANNGSAVVGVFGVSGNFIPDTYTVTFNQATPADPVTYTVTDSALGVVSSGTYEDGASISFAGAHFKLNGNPADGDTIALSPSVKQDIFTTVKALADALNRPAPDAASKARFHNEMAQGLANIDQGLENFTSIRAGIGARLNTLDTLNELNQDFQLQLQTTLSETQDLDYAEAISRFNLQLTALQAAQQAYIKTTGLSLFNYL